MTNTGIHEVVMGDEKYDTMSADTALYGVIGERFYVPFDRLIVPEDRETFYRMAKEDLVGEGFLIHLTLEDDSQMGFFCRISDHSQGTLTIQLVKAADIFEDRRRQREDLARKNAILDLYQDTFFEYDPETESVSLASILAGVQNVTEDSLEHFEQGLLERADGEGVEDIRQFVRDIRGGARRFELHADRNLINGREDVTGTTIRAASIYDDGQFATAVGYIHLGTEYRQNTGRRIELDSLTGLYAKAEITNMAIDTVDVRKIKNTTLAIIDIDYFKKVNDTFGHMYGDKVIKTVAAIMEKEVSGNGAVGRIGGDEFMIIFYDAYDMENMRERLRSLKTMVKTAYPPGRDDAPAITLSIGCAAYPKDAHCYEDLFILADYALYRAKEKGRDRYIIYNKSLHESLEAIKSATNKPMARIDSRGNMSLGDILCVIMNRVYNREAYPLQDLLDDFVVNFGIQRILVYIGEPWRVSYMAGEKRLSKERLEETEEAACSGKCLDYFDKQGVWQLNDVKYLKAHEDESYDVFARQGVLSFVKVRFTDKDGRPGILSLEAVRRRVDWNKSNIGYYALFARLLSEYSVAAEE